jgi:hypothetical protein
MKYAGHSPVVIALVRAETEATRMSYYEIRSETERPSGAPTKMNAAQPAAAAHRRMP